MMSHKMSRWERGRDVLDLLLASPRGESLARGTKVWRCTQCLDAYVYLAVLAVSLSLPSLTRLLFQVSGSARLPTCMSVTVPIRRHQSLLYRISVIFTCLETCCFYWLARRRPLKKNHPKCKPSREAERQKDVRRGKCPAVLKRLKQELFFFRFFCCCSSASRRDYGFNRHVFTRPLNLKCEPGVWGHFKQWQPW